MRWGLLDLSYGVSRRRAGHRWHAPDGTQVRCEGKRVLSCAVCSPSPTSAHGNALYPIYTTLHMQDANIHSFCFADHTDQGNVEI